MEVFDIRARGTLPSFAIGPAGKVVGIGWNFNVWGEKFSGYAADRVPLVGTRSFISQRPLALDLGLGHRFPLVTAKQN